MTIVHFVVGDKFGGVETHICTLVKLMDNAGYQFKIVCHESIERHFRERLAGEKVDIIPLKIWPKPSLSGYLKLIRTFKKISPDIVHCHLYSGTRMGAMAAKLAGVPTVIETIHTEEVWRKGFKKWMYCTIDAVLGRLFLKEYIAVSQAVANYYQKNKWVPDRKIVLIYSTREKDRIELNPKKEFSYRIGFLGRLSDEKGLDILIQAISLLKQRNESWHLYIGGTGPLKQDLENQAEVAGIEDSVTFLGNVSDKNKFFDEIDIFVLPSRFEGFSLVLLEAGMYQMPVVATNVSGNPEIIRHKETGILVEKENPHNLASAIEAYQDEENRERYSGNLKSLVESEFSNQKYVEKMNAFYKSLVK